MFTSLLHRIVARPWVYDLAQLAIGARSVRARLEQMISPFKSAGRVLDIGGGTGSISELWNSESKYICLDIDPLKLQGFSAKNPSGIALLADATRIPIADGQVDVVLCTNVTHHLTDDLLDRMFAETARVLKPDGKFVLSDAIWAPTRRVGRLVWHYDRGSHPRSADVLRAGVAKYLAIEQWDQFAIWHEYIICVAGHAALRNGSAAISRDHAT